MKLRVILSSLLLVTGLATLVSADAVYHSEHLPFYATGAEGHPELQAGALTNIHPNGPNNGAIQQYNLTGARPNTVYSIYESVFTDCSPDAQGLLVLSRDTITTDEHGNGYVQFRITAEELAPYSGLTIGAHWTLEVGDVVAYETECTIGTID